MASMEPAAALVTCENALRQLMEVIFAADFGQDWLSQVAPVEEIARWKGRREIERKKRETKGAWRVPDSELAYADFSHLRRLAERHWDHLLPALGELEETGALLKRFDDLRNTVAHSRDPLPFEADLLAGIAGEIRNRVTVYMSKQDAEGHYYPRIESAVASFGNSLSTTWAATRPGDVFTELTLRPGQVVLFRCRGTDPQGRPLEWWLQQHAGVVQSRAEGPDVTLTWAVGDDEVGRSIYACVRMQAKGAKYHRRQHDDQSVTFTMRCYHPPPKPARAAINRRLARCSTAARASTSPAWPPTSSSTTYTTPPRQPAPTGKSTAIPGWNPDVLTW